MSEVTYFRGGRAEARRVINAFVGMLTGRIPDQGGLARSVFLVLGFAALSDIAGDFVRKARGQVGEDGVQWPRLSPKTLAYSRRFGKGEQAELKRAAGLGTANRFGIGQNTGLLTKAQQKRWKKLYAQALAWLAQRESLDEAKAHAAAIAWNKLKQEGAKTKLEVYGHRPHEVLRDTGVLLNSLSPGRLDGGSSLSYTPPTGDGGSDQIFASLSNGIIVGTNVPYASAHQNGNASKGIPARPFLPTGAVPGVWLERWSNAGMQAVAASIRQALQSGRI